MRTFSGRRASQNDHELNSFKQLLIDRGVTKYLELGARHGDTFWSVMTSLPVGSVGVAVDLPGGLWGTEASRDHLQRAVADLCQRGYKASFLFGDSQTEATKRLIVGRGPFDAILIDGDHTLPGVTRDWDLYGDMAKIVAFHDIVGTGQAEKVYGNPVEVPILWDRIKHSGLVTVEYVGEGSAMGIGCVLR